MFFVPSETRFQFIVPFANGTPFVSATQSNENGASREPETFTGTSACSPSLNAVASLMLIVAYRPKANPLAMT